MDAIGTDKGIGPAVPALPIGLVDGNRYASCMRDDVPGPDAERNVDIGEAPTGLVEHVGKVGPMHDGIGRAETGAHDGAELHADQRALSTLRIDVEGGGFEGDAI